MAAKVSVITPVWNQSHHTARYLIQAYQAYRNSKDVEFIIINNGSTDQTSRLLGDYLHKMNSLKVITNEDNQGFPIACNQGARKAAGDVLLFLNNDVIAWSDYITPIKESACDNVIFGPELNDYNTGWNKFGDVVVPYIAGWCLVITRKAFETLGGFDERYSPADYEDVDLCFSMLKDGGNILKLDLPIRHISGQTGQQLPNRQAITETNRIKFSEKWGLQI